MNHRCFKCLVVPLLPLALSPFALLLYISLEHLYFFPRLGFQACFRDSPSGKKGNSTLTISSISTIYNMFGVNLPTVWLGVA